MTRLLSLAAHVRPLLAWALVMLCATIALHCEPIPAHAQSGDASLLLARVCVNEGGFSALADCDAIGAISIRQSRLRRMPLVAYLRARFLRALAPADQRRNRTWIADLQRNEHAPIGWPHESQPWSARRDQWRDLLARTDAIVAGEIELSCTAQTWGSEVYDREQIARILANGGRVVDCGATRNVFLRFR